MFCSHTFRSTRVFGQASQSSFAIASIFVVVALAACAQDAALQECAMRQFVVWIKSVSVHSTLPVFPRLMYVASSIILAATWIKYMCRINADCYHSSERHSRWRWKDGDKELAPSTDVLLLSVSPCPTWSEEFLPSMAAWTKSLFFQQSWISCLYIFIDLVSTTMDTS